MNDTFTFGSAGLIHELELGMRRAGGWDQSLVKLLSSGDHLVHVRDYLRGQGTITLVVKTEERVKSVPAETFNLLTVPADVSFAERIARGQYDWINDNLTEKRFPVTADQIGEFEWKLFHFDCNISSEEAIRHMKKEGYDAGAIGHILVFGEQYPEEQRKYPIIALGSVALLVLRRGVPALWGGGGGRELRLLWFGFDWSPGYRFLGVRKRSVA